MLSRILAGIKRIARAAASPSTTVRRCRCFPQPGRPYFPSQTFAYASDTLEPISDRDPSSKMTVFHSSK